ncbi:MAG: ParB/RepB/Spo0J family partition protein [Pseudomonadota bacterium]
MSERKVLGRGLSSLIPSLPQAKEASPLGVLRVPLGATAGEVATRTAMAPVSEIFTNPRQPRRQFSEKALAELSASIREVGILQPLLVRSTDRGYELIAGERRLRAARKAGLTEVPVLVRNSSDLDQLEMALVENLQREDLNPIEEAHGFARLANEFGLKQEEIAKRVGKDRSTVTNIMRLLGLSAVAQEMLASGAISMGHARALLPLEDPRRQETLAHRIQKETLSVRQVEALVRAMTGPAGAPEGRRRTDKTAQETNLRHLADELQRSLGTRVEITARGKSGEIRIHYYAPEDLRRVVDRLLK